MAFFADEDLDGLAISQSVFHIVGPRREHFQLLEEFDAAAHAPFFLGRIRSVNSGNQYSFLSDAAVRTQLSRIVADPSAFQGESEKLADAFDEGHRGSSAIGAFMVLTLRCASGKAFALLKFEDEKVLSYAFAAGKSGKPKPTFGEIERTIVQNRNALQKAALIRLGPDGSDRISVTDRQNPQRPAAYFEQFLGVRRARTERELTQTLVEVAKEVARHHKDDLPKDVMTALSRRLYDSSQSEGKVDGERVEDWFKSIVGPLPDNSPVLKTLAVRMKREGLTGESFVLQKGAVAEPRNLRAETASGVRVTYPAGLAGSVVVVDKEKRLITIKDEITIDDVELEKAPRARA